MFLKVEVSGRIRTVLVEPIGRSDRQFGVTIDGQRRIVDARFIDAFTLSLISLDGSSVSHDVRLIEGNVPGELIVCKSEGSLSVVVNGSRSRRLDSDSSTGLAGEQRVIAPMPGKVVRILVETGTAVKFGQGLVVVEAMKMENELVSPKAGRISQITVEEGTTVTLGQLVAVVE